MEYECSTKTNSFKCGNVTAPPTIDWRKKGAVTPIQDQGMCVDQSCEGGTCGTKLDHEVTTVGCGVSADETKYWLVKNSWGAEWDEEGYIRMQRDVETKGGLYGIAGEASYPTP
ncbi:hypothetical protein ACFX1W_012770 [Malus domestica]